MWGEQRNCRQSKIEASVSLVFTKSNLEKICPPHTIVSVSTYSLESLISELWPGELRECEDILCFSDGEVNDKSGGSVFDSPASPDMDPAHHVSGSPLKIIPRSPMRDVQGDQEEEDMDEDLLYLRLIALRSLAEENKAEQSGDSKLAEEMKELLEEAEDAANENSDKVETGKTSNLTLLRGLIRMLDIETILHQCQSI